MPGLCVMVKSTISFLIPFHCRLLLSGFETQIFVGLFGWGRSGTECIQKKWWKNGEGKS